VRRLDAKPWRRQTIESMRIALCALVWLLPLAAYAQDAGADTIVLADTGNVVRLELRAPHLCALFPEVRGADCQDPDLVGLRDLVLAARPTRPGPPIEHVSVAVARFDDMIAVVDITRTRVASSTRITELDDPDAAAARFYSGYQSAGRRGEASARRVRLGEVDAIRLEVALIDDQLSGVIYTVAGEDGIYVIHVLGPERMAPRIKAYADESLRTLVVRPRTVIAPQSTTAPAVSKRAVALVAGIAAVVVLILVSLIPVKKRR
jgi:hypothetical protein